MAFSWEAALLLKLDVEIIEDENSPWTYVRHRFVEDRALWRRPLRPLGKGGMGEVYREDRVEGSVTSAVRAVKIIEKPKSRGSKDINYSRELKAIAHFSQPQFERWFVKSSGWYDNNDFIFINMEFFEHGDLYNYVGDSILPETEIQLLVAQMLTGLSYMHDLGYAHRDLKPQNLLVLRPGPAWHIKLADFGLSKKVVGNNTSFSTVVGTPAFMAPEVLGLGDDEASEEHDRQSYSYSVDIWAVGVIAFILLTGDVPFRTDYGDRRALSRYAKGKDRLPVQGLQDRGMAAGDIALIQSFLASEPASRPTTHASLRHIWLANAQSGNVARTPMDADNGSASDNLRLPVRPAAERVVQRPNLPITNPEIRNHHPRLTNITGAAPINDVASPANAPLMNVPPANIPPANMPPRNVPPGPLRQREYWCEIALSPNGDLLAAVAAGVGSQTRDHDELLLFEIATATTLKKWSIGEILVIAFSPNGTLLAAITYKSGFLASSFVYVLDVSTFKHVRQFEISTLLLPNVRLQRSLDFTPDGRLLTVPVPSRILLSEEQIKLCNVNTGNPVARLRWKEDDYVLCKRTAFSPDGRFAARVVGYNTVGVFKIGQEEPAAYLKPSAQRIYGNSVVFSPDGKLLAFSGQVGQPLRDRKRQQDVSNQRLWVFDSEKWKKVQSMDVRRVQCGVLMTFSPEGTRLAVEVRDAVKRTVGIQIWDVFEASLITTYWSPTIRANFNLLPFGSLSYSRDGQLRAVTKGSHPSRTLLFEGGEWRPLN